MANVKFTLRPQLVDALLGDNFDRVAKELKGMWPFDRTIDLTQAEVNLVLTGGGRCITPKSDGNRGTWYGPVAFAAKEGNVEMIEFLLKIGIPVDWHGMGSPLLHAITWNQVDVVHYLLNVMKPKIDYRGKSVFACALETVLCTHNVAMMRTLEPHTDKRALIPLGRGALERADWRMCSFLNEKGLLNVDGGVLAIFKSYFWEPMDRHNGFVQTLELILSIDGRKQFYDLNIKPAALPEAPLATLGTPWKKVVSARLAIECFYNEACKNDHWMRADYRRLLFRGLRKAQRLWVKAFEHVRHAQALLREAEAAEIKALSKERAYDEHVAQDARDYEADMDQGFAKRARLEE